MTAAEREAWASVLTNAANALDTVIEDLEGYTERAPAEIRTTVGVDVDLAALRALSSRCYAAVARLNLWNGAST